MPKLPLPDPDEAEPQLPTDDGAYDLPPELEEEPRPRARKARDARAEPTARGDADVEALEAEDLAAVARPRPAALRIAIGVGVVLVAAALLLWYRNHHRAQVVAEGLREASQLLRLDTRAAYEAAARKLEVPSRDEYDPLDARSARAFALALIHADYSDPAAIAAGEEARALLVEAERAEVMPEWARLARAALALARDSKGDAATELAQVDVERAWAATLQARVYVLADQLDAAVEPAALAAGDAAFVPGLAIEGDVARRARKDAPAARASYLAALAPSRDPATAAHGPSARATFGLAKLALAGGAPAGEATAALEAFLGAKPAAPGPERARAALHLAALRLRAGDAGAAAAALDAAGLAGADRTWAEHAARRAAATRGAYRAAPGAPPALRSKLDDDPPEAEPPPPPPAPEVRPPPPPVKAAVKPSRAGTRKAAAKATTRAGARTTKKVVKKPAVRTTTKAKPSTRTRR